MVFCATIAMHQVIEFYEQNLQLARETGDRRGELSALGSLGRAYEALNETDKAREYFEMCLTVAREIGDLGQERTLLKHLNSGGDKKAGRPESHSKSRKKSDDGDSPSRRKKAGPKSRKTP